MWIFTTFGFFSIVQKQSSDDFLTIRVRAAGDLDRLRERVPQLSPTITGGGSDYPYRATIPHAELALALANIIREIRYSNFKSAAAKELGNARTPYLHQVWDVMYKLSTDEPTQSAKPDQHSPRIGANAFGGVVIDLQNRVLLREPMNHYGGYVWTFAKGKPDPGETPKQTAIREVREELGVEAEIIEPVPSVFRGDTSTTQFFLMRYVRNVSEPSSETSSIRWASFSEARPLINQTTTNTGRQRDLAVLDAVQALPSVQQGAPSGR
jgi:8-oxo-dGTP pyrophosphatase MutT (NUDIX family)